MMNMKRLMPSVLVLVVVATLLPERGYAGSQAEYQALQQWCVGRDKWTAEGRKTDYPNPPKYLHFQHYCTAMNALNRQYATIDPIKLSYEAGLVVGDTGYIISRASAINQFLMPEVYALRGRAQLLAKQMPQAEASLMKALQLDPGHVAAYLSLGNLYFETNRKAKAIETTKAGLAIDPQHKALRRLAAKLEIKLEEAKLEALKPNSDISSSEPNKKMHEKQMQTTKPDATEGSSTPAAPQPAVTLVEDASAKGSTTQGKAGAPFPKSGPLTNPWCRFCPDSPSTDRPASSPAAEPKVSQ